MILERLDRGVATDSWFAMFPTMCETHLVTPSSDHAPLLFHASNKKMRMRGYKKSFRFENMWVRHEGCAEVVKEAWQQEQIANLEDLAKGLENCGKLLNKWNREVFGNIQVSLKQKEKELEELLTSVIRTKDVNAITTCRNEMHELAMREEILWKQRAKTMWLKEGDKNTKFFHGVASSRRRNNRIEKN